MTRLEKKYGHLFREAQIPILVHDVKKMCAQKYPSSAAFPNIGKYPGFFQCKHCRVWPTFKVQKKTIPYLFLMQYYNPIHDQKNKHQDLIQVWVPPLEYVDEHSALIKIIPYSYLNDALVEYITPEAVSKYEDAPSEKQGFIKKWKTVNEPGNMIDENLDYLERHGTQDEYKEFSNLKPPMNVVKLGGYGATTQGIDFHPFISNVYLYQWGDAGTVHILKDGKMEGDMH